MIDVRPDYLLVVKDILKRHVPTRQVVAFGSRVTWTAKQYSDLDLAVMGESEILSSGLADMKEVFTESNLAFSVDVVDWAATQDNFRRIIEKAFVVVQEGRHNREWGGRDARSGMRRLENTR
jgi:predicted nucleotidyltransferase